MHNDIALLIPIFAILGGITMIIFIRRYEYLEKQQMIEKGMDPTDFMKVKKSSGWGAVRFAFTAIGVGLGIFIASVLDSWGMDDDTVYPAMILIMGGIGLFAGTHYSKNQERKETD